MLSCYLSDITVRVNRLPAGFSVPYSMRWVGGTLWDLTDRRPGKDIDFVGQLLMGTLIFTYPAETAGVSIVRN